eukprot:jgi/Mesen1/7883/ME000420S07026
MPLVSILDEVTFKRVAAPGQTLVLYVDNFDSQAPSSLAFDAPDPAKADSPAGIAVVNARRLKPVARVFRDFAFAYVDASKYPGFVSPFGIQPDSPLPDIFVWRSGTTEFYSSARSADFRGEDMEFALTHFLQDIRAGRLEAKTTRDPPLWAKIQNFVYNPAFPYVMAIILMAIVMKVKERGAPIILGNIKGKNYRDLKAKIDERKKKRKEEKGEKGAKGEGQTSSEREGKEPDLGVVKADEDKKKE